MKVIAVGTAVDHGIPTLDWEGQPISCEHCAARDLAIQCELGRACVQDRYAKRIDRFFRWNPERGNDFLNHPYFEVRAIACRHADVFHLMKMLGDEDETVRMSVAARLPPSLLPRLRDDPHREVRIRVAQRLEPGELAPMIDDADYYVRKLIARRLPEALLLRLLGDPEWEVRIELARRLPMPHLLRLVDDDEVSVRREVVRHLPAALLSRMANDAAWEVRWELAQCCDAALARRLIDDPEKVVAEAAAGRLKRLSEPEGADHG